MCGVMSFLKTVLGITKPKLDASQYEGGGEGWRKGDSHDRATTQYNVTNINPSM